MRSAPTSFRSRLISVGILPLRARHGGAVMCCGGTCPNSPDSLCRLVREICFGQRRSRPE